MGKGGDVWSDDLTEAQLRMVIVSGHNERWGGGFGVDVRGAAWRTAGSLVAKGLGTIEGGAPQGSVYPGLYFNNAEGVRIVHEFDDLDDDAEFSGRPA